MRLSTILKAISALVLFTILLGGFIALQISKSLTPKEELLNYVDNTISRVNDSAYKNISTNSFSKLGPAILIVDKKDRVYSSFDNEIRMQIDGVEYLKNVPLYVDALREPAVDLGLDPDLGWISHPLKMEAAKQIRRELSINFENDRKIIQEISNIKREKTAEGVVFELRYPVELEVKHHKLGGNFSGSIYKRLVFKDGVLKHAYTIPYGQARDHLASSTSSLTFANFNLSVPEKVLPIDSLSRSSKFRRAQSIITQKVFMTWVLRVALSKSNQNGRDFSSEILTDVVKDFIEKRYVPPQSSLQIINNKVNLTSFASENRDVNNPDNIVSCGTIEDGKMIITGDRCQ